MTVNFECHLCKESIPSLPSNALILAGDTFYTLTCGKCSSIRAPIFERQLLSWKAVTHLVLYHLHTRSPSQSYFRWKEDICAFMEENWISLLPGKLINSTNWQNSVSSVLSLNVDLFANGLEAMGEQGWWRLVDKYKPPVNNHNSSCAGSSSATRKQKVPPSGEQKLSFSSTDGSASKPDDLKEQLLKKLLAVDKSLLSKALNSDLLASTKKGDSQPGSTPKGKNEAVNVGVNKKNPACNPVSPSRYITVVEAEILKKCLSFVNPPWQVRQLARKILNRRAKRLLGFTIFDIDAFIYEYLKSEEPLYICENPPSAPEGQIDAIKKRTPNHLWSDGSILVKNPELSFRAHVLGISSVIEGWPEVPIESPYTGNRLPAVVATLKDIVPTQLALLHELELRNEKGEDELEYIKIHHIRKEFVPQINRLLKASFWPRIDVTEHLENPDYTLVALYKLKVVAVALLNPDGYLEFLTVEQGWQNAGLAKRLLYLLLQKAPPKDITLHVAPDNEAAMMLYQQIGFKVDRYVLGFYDKYFPPEYSGTRNAFFMRLRR